MSNLQMEHLLHLLKTMVTQQARQAKALEDIGASLDTLNDRIYDLPYRLRQEGIL